VSRAAQKQRTREHLYETAMGLFARQGYEVVNVDDIVRAAEVSRGTFYFHFPAKEDVLVEAIRQGEALILRRLAELGASVRLRPLLTATVHGFIEAWDGRRELLPHAGAVALRRVAGVTVEREGDPLRLELGRRVAEAQRQGELRSPLPGPMLADIFLLDVFAALMSWSTTGTPPVEVLVPGVVELFFGGIRGLARAAPGARRAPSPPSPPSTAGRARPPSPRGSRRTAPRSRAAASRRGAPV
jgi:AcrR family transcriptional regulator